MPRKKIVTEASRAEEARRADIDRALSAAWIAGGIQNSATDRAAYVGKIVREVRRLGGDAATAETAKRWASEILDEHDLGTHEGLQAARAQAAARGEKIAQRVHQTVEERLSAERQDLTPAEVTEAVTNDLAPGAAARRDRNRAATEHHHDGPPTEERQAVLDAVTTSNRPRRRELHTKVRDQAAGGDGPVTVQGADGVIRRGGAS